MITVWIVSVRISVSCALKNKTGATIVMPRYEKSKGLYLPVLTNERSSARIIGQAIVVPFLLFLFHTIKIHFRLIGIGARGSTPPPTPLNKLARQAAHTGLLPTHHL